jgi:2-oxo-hept-3-ene-1,7-dioate hydratase
MPMSEQSLEPILDAVWQGAINGRFEPPDQEIDLAAGQQLQLRLLERWHERGESVGGWKLGMTSGQSRDAFGVGFRPFGFILNSRILTSGAQISASTIQRGGVENELCFIIGEALGASATRQSAMAAVAAVAPAFEINQRRIQLDAPPAIRIADDLSNWGLVVGQPVKPPADLDDLTIVLTSSGVEVDRVEARNHIDDHFESLATLAHKLAEHGLELRPGDRVITGAYTRTPLQIGSYEGDFGSAIGRVEVEVGP